MLVWLCPQDPYYTGALHAFLPNLDDIPIIKRKTKRTTKCTTHKRTTQLSLLMIAIKILNEPLSQKMQPNNQQNDNRRKRSRSPRAYETPGQHRQRSPSRDSRPPRAPSITRELPQPETPDLLSQIQILLSQQKPLALPQRPSSQPPSTSYSRNEGYRYEGAQEHSYPDQRYEPRHEPRYDNSRRDEYRQEERRNDYRPDDRQAPNRQQNFEKTPFGMFGGQVLLPTTNIAPGVMSVPSITRISGY